MCRRDRGQPREKLCACYPGTMRGRSTRRATSALHLAVAGLSLTACPDQTSRTVERAGGPSAAAPIVAAAARDGGGGDAPALSTGAPLPPDLEPSEDEVQPPEPTDAADEEVAEARALDRLLCRRRGCCVTKVEDAGRTRQGQGHTLTVVTVDASGAVCLAPPQLEPEPFGTGVLDRAPSPTRHGKASRPGRPPRDDRGQDHAAPAPGDLDDVPEEADCRPFEFHLVVREKGKLLGRQLLSRACNDGHGTGGMGDDLITVDARARTFTHTQSGGSAWRGDRSVTVGLDPLRIARVETSSFWAGDADGSWQSTEWNWDLFRGDKTWPVADCGRAQRAHRSPARAIERKKIRALLIPRVTVPATFAGDGWRTTPLGPCGLHLSGREAGFVIQGSAGKPRDASMALVLSRDDVLFLEIVDDRWIDAASTRLREDHVQVWLADSSVGQNAVTVCEAPRNGARQWSVRVGDGAVLPGVGAPPGLSGVEVTRRGRVARLKIPLGPERASGATRLTVAYADSDDGIHLERVLATSELDPGRPETLGDVWEVEPEEATCVATRKGLAVSRPSLRPIPNAPVGQP